LKNGKPFFPIGIYHVASDQIDEAAAIGFNMFQFWAWDATPENMNRLGEKGISVLWEGQAWGRAVTLAPSALKDNQPFQKELAIQREIAANYKTHPALDMWYVADEPSPTALPALRMINKTWHEVDEDHPTYLVATGNYGYLQEACDVLGIDVYLVYRGDRKPLSTIADATDDALRGVDYRKPVIAIPQAFGNNERHREKPEDVRAISYLHLTHGVKGVIWYCWKETGDKTGDEGMGFHPETQKVVKELVSEIKTFAPALLEPGVRQLKSSDGKVHALIAGSDSTGRYLLFVNSEETASDAVLQVPELSGKRLKELFGTPAAEVRNGNLQMKVAPLATGVFQIK